MTACEEVGSGWPFFRFWRARLLALTCCLGLMLALDAGQVCPASTSWSGKVLCVVDGDTLKILQGKLARTVRLVGVDTPQRGQPFGEEARRFAQGLAQGRMVTVEPHGGASSRRQRGQVILPDGRDLGLELLKEGLAWHDPRRSGDPFLRDLEGNARKERLGLWAEANPVPPWRWRPHQRQDP